MAYNWEQPDWPNFRYDLSGLQDSLLLLAERTGRASGLLQGLTPDAQVEATVMIMVTYRTANAAMLRRSAAFTRPTSTFSPT
ncbi:MAG: DUF4172 domain-containing protein [Nitrospira sp.]|nr:MAG: DUF4172 domain-containing protein [Nitrospira sp.]